MATISFYITDSVKSSDKRMEIQVRLNGGKLCDKRAKTGIFVTIENWDYAKGMPRDKRSNRYDPECEEIRKRLTVLYNYLQEKWTENFEKGSVNGNSLRTWLDDIKWEVSEDLRGVKTWEIISKSEMAAEQLREEVEAKKIENWYLLDALAEFAYEQLENGKICKRRFDHYNSVAGVWDRMELFVGKKFLLKDLTTEDMYGFRRFLINEHTLWTERKGKQVPKPQYRYLYNEYRMTLSRGVPERSLNYVNTEMKYLITFWHWLIKVRGCKVGDIFASFKRDNTVFGTPFFITSEDRTLLFNADLSARPCLAVQRDIFVFQSLIGCRVSDLLRMKKSNIVDGNFLQYVACKTKNNSGKVLNVPLHKDAKTIIARYADTKGDALLPFISAQKYNQAIKEMFKAVPEVDKIVTVLNPVTRQEEQKYLHEVASSHMARRNFCGNLYEAGFADSDIGSMSGHSEKSREIARYRKVSVERQVKMIDTL